MNCTLFAVIVLLAGLLFWPLPTLGLTSGYLILGWIHERNTHNAS